MTCPESHRQAGAEQGIQPGLPSPRLAALTTGPSFLSSHPGAVQSRSRRRAPLYQMPHAVPPAATTSAEVGLQGLALYDFSRRTGCLC